MELAKTHIAAIRSSGVMRAAMLQAGITPDLLDVPLVALSEEEFADIHDYALDALVNASETVEQYIAEEDLGEYFISVRGVQGAYYVETVDRDDLGPFHDLETARDAMNLSYGEFIVSGPD